MEETVILELKSIETILPVHEAQLVTYLRLSGKRLGLLINFNVPMLKNGIRRRILDDVSYSMMNGEKNIDEHEREDGGTKTQSCTLKP